MHGNAIKDLQRGVINESERFGALYWLNDEEKEIVEEFEKDGGRMVYHIIHDRTNIGELYNILYVDFDDEEWAYDTEDLKHGQTLAYVLNKSMPDCSEYGRIGIKPSFGGVIRTW